MAYTPEYLKVHFYTLRKQKRIHARIFRPNYLKKYAEWRPKKGKKYLSFNEGGGGWTKNRLEISEFSINGILKHIEKEFRRQAAESNDNEMTHKA